MAGQSLAMGEAFGKGFQYGKRKISSMSNEEFNKLDFRELSESLATDYRVMIPSLVESIQASDRLQDAVFKALADVIKEIPSQILDFFGDVTGGTRADLGSTTTSTSASTLGTITNVRAGSGLGDIRKQQEQLKDEQIISEQQRNKRIQDNLARVKQQNLEAASRARTALEAKLKTEQQALAAQVAKTGVVSSRRAAGQSQIIQRTQLLNAIAKQARHISAFRKNWSAQALESQMAKMRAFQAQLTILLQRYRF